MAAKRLGRFAIKNSGLFLCDMQEKFRPSIQYFPQIVATSNRLLQAAKILDMPVVITEQYPKGLGPTVSELEVGDYPAPIFPKTKFSMALPEVEAHLAKVAPDLRTVILCGIETQVCIQQTVMDLLERDYEVHVLADCVSSRTMVDRLYALERMKDAGAFITTSESALLGLLQDASHPKFREVQKLMWESAPDSGLLNHQPDPALSG